MPSTWTNTAHLRNQAGRFSTLLVALYLLLGNANLVSSSALTLLPIDMGPRVEISVEQCPAQVFQEFNTNPRRRRVQPMIPEAADRCAHYHYDTVIMPNLVGQNSQQEALAAFDSYHLLQMTNCSSELGFFLCMMHYPMYSEMGEYRIPIAPSRSLCNRVRNECEGIMNFREYEWPAQLSCDMMPEVSEFCMDDAFYPCLNRELDLIQASAAGNETTRSHAMTTATAPTAAATTTARSSGGAQGRVATAPLLSSATWQRAPASSSRPQTVRDDSRNAYPGAGARCMLTKSDQAPPADRDVIAALGFAHSPRCCAACSNRVRRNVRSMVSGSGNASLWSWAFMGSMLEANVTIRDGRRYFVLRASISFMLQEREGTNLTGQGGELLMHLPPLTADDCVCARPDKVVTNVFMGTMAPTSGQDGGGGAPVYVLRHMDAIWPSPSNGYPLPRMYNKWKKLLRTNRKKARKALQTATAAAGVAERTARRPTPSSVRAATRWQASTTEVRRPAGVPSPGPGGSDGVAGVDVPLRSRLESLSSRQDQPHGFRPIVQAQDKENDKEEALLGTLGAAPATQQQRRPPPSTLGDKEADEDADSALTPPPPPPR